MVLIISMMIGLSLFIIIFPYELVIRKNSYRLLMDTNHNLQQNRINYENTMIKQSIKLSRLIFRNWIPRVSESYMTKITKRITYAGYINKILVNDFMQMKYTMLLVTIVFFGVIMSINYSQFNFVLTCIASMMAYYVPDHFLITKAKERQQAINRELPNVLSSLAVVTDSGLNLLQSVEVTVKQNKGVFIDELRKTLEDIYFGISQKEAFIRLAHRSDVEEVNYFVSALVQGMDKGSSGITDAIREQARESWEKRKHIAKELAEKASLKLFMPMMFLVFPAFLILLIGPVIFSVIKIF